MTSKTQPLENTSVSTWLAELHMECYKKNLENFDTIRVSAIRLHRWSLVCMYYVLDEEVWCAAPNSNLVQLYSNKAEYVQAKVQWQIESYAYFAVESFVY